MADQGKASGLKQQGQPPDQGPIGQPKDSFGYPVEGVMVRPNLNDKGDVNTDGPKKSIVGSVNEL